MSAQSAVQWYSQPATRQDEWVIAMHGEKPGFFVEIGAHNGYRHSNTLALEETFEWKGLLVEPHPDLYPQMVARRPNCLHSKAVVSGNTEEQVTFLLGQGTSASFSGLRGWMCDDWRREHKHHGSVKTLVDTVPLGWLLHTTRGVPKVIDYLSLDVEGAEHAILEGFVSQGWFKTFRIRLLTVEFRYDRLLLDRLERLLEPFMVLSEVRAFDACFVSR